MKLLCFCLSFALVNDSVAELDKYVKQVILTIEHIKLVEADLPKVIKDIFLKGYMMTEMTLMLGLPENKTNLTVDDMHDMKTCQRLVRSHIHSVTGIEAPRINEDDFHDANLTNLENARRLLTLPAIKKLIRAVISENYSEFGVQLTMCRLMGLYRAIENPAFCIITAGVDGGFCYISAIDRIHFKYKYIRGHFYEFDDDGLPVDELDDQVRENN